MWPRNTFPTAASDSLSLRGRASCNGTSKNSWSKPKGGDRRSALTLYMDRSILREL